MQSIILAAVIAAALAGDAGASDMSDVLWLSETAPPKSAAAPAAGESQHETQYAEHEHHDAAMSSMPPSSGVAAKNAGHGDQINLSGEAGGKDYEPGKELWLRQGGVIKTSAYVTTASENNQLTMLDFKGGQSKLDAAQVNNRLMTKLSLPKIGFYEAYLEQRSVKDGQLQVQLPKAELVWATCSVKETDEDAIEKPIVNPASPLELVRKHLEDEGCMNRIVSGTGMDYTVFSYGKPVAGAVVTMITQEGWRNERVSDAAGRVSFIMIRDYFPQWLQFMKYHAGTFLAVAELRREETGALDGKHYTSAHYIASLPGKYRPSPTDYRSYAWGLGIALFVIVFGGLAVYLYRRRRVKPYQEVRLDDKA